MIDFQRLACVDTLDFHLAHPEIPVHVHTTARNRQHGRRILGKTRIYLDQKWWNYFRDVLRGRPQKPEHPGIWELLLGLVESGLVVCPAGDTVYLETLKQTDRDSLTLTAAVLDRLTGQAAFRHAFERQRAELFYFFATRIRPDLGIGLREDVWTFPGFLLGELLPGLSRCPQDTQAALQKSWFDLVSSWQFSDLLVNVKSNGPRDHDLIQQLAKGKEAHREDISSFEDALKIEARGFLQGCARDFEAVYSNLSSAGFLHPKEAGLATPAQGGYALGALTLHLLTTGQAAWTQLPSVHISAGIQAEIRSSARRYHQNDTFDWHHAAQALPYCNFFFTEKALYHLLRSPKLGFDKAYDCCVLWKEEEIIAALDGLAAQAA